MMEKFCETCRFWIEDVQTRSTIPEDNYRCYNPATMREWGLAGPSLTGNRNGCGNWVGKDLERCERCGLKNCMCDFGELIGYYAKPFRKIGTLDTPNKYDFDHPKQERPSIGTLSANPPKGEKFKIIPGKDFNAAHEDFGSNLSTATVDETKVTQEITERMFGRLTINGVEIDDKTILAVFEKLGIDSTTVKSVFADFIGILEEKMR